MTQAFDNTHFYYDLATKEDSWGGLPQIWRGDFNCTLDPALVRSGAGTVGWLLLLEQVKKVASALGLVDVGRLGALEQDLEQLEEEQELNADDQTLGRIRAKLTEFQDTAGAKVQHMGKYATARVYGERERPGSTLAKVIRPNRDSLITVIQAEDDSEIREPELIPKRFYEYYQSLYATKIVQDPEGLLDYLTHTEMPRLAVEDRVPQRTSDARRNE
ncbi:hypothetical protein NDU88_003916 [Pleurodeles waltl]|uniref:Uncharacterized protein n=1 Tax=Pleurodeles waltl TaxID=8319 RepID=A0AAV7LID7_PLEWA|nr:hypothetical protein NDU88_003916 [Pleurodeles waltl]